MSKSKKSFNDLNKELQMLQDQQNKMVEIGAKIFWDELLTKEASLKRLMADSSPAELKKAAQEIAPMVVRAMSQSAVKVQSFN